jgi:quinol monooxygenase YgiN
MPVIRFTPTATVFRREERDAMIAQLAKELAGETTEQGPVVFEIPLEGTEKFDALVVWEKWKDISSPIRSEIILAAYKEKKELVAQPLGVTYKEAVDQNLLPYSRSAPLCASCR